MNLKFDQPQEFLGKQSDSREIIDLLEMINRPRRVKIMCGEADTYVSNEQLGVSLLFESERYIHGQYGVNFPFDAPVLTAIFLYGPNHSDFCECVAPLLEDLKFSDGQEKAREKLGASVRFSEKFNSESWDFPNKISIIVDYTENQNSIAMIQFGIEL